jgi:hypothetical protein
MRRIRLKPGKRGPSKRKVAGHVTSTKLWLVDLSIFEEERVRQKVSAAKLLRKIVHSWAVTKRLSGELTDVIEGIVERTQERVIAEQLAPVLESISLGLGQLKVPADHSACQNRIDDNPFDLKGNDEPH